MKKLKLCLQCFMELKVKHLRLRYEYHSLKIRLKFLTHSKHISLLEESISFYKFILCKINFKFFNNSLLK